MIPERIAALQELQERVRKASGPDRELDRLLLNALVPPKPHQYQGEPFFTHGDLWWAVPIYDDANELLNEADRAACLTGSIDATFELADQRLPGFDVYVRRYASGGAFGWISSESEGEYFQEYGATPALALLSALLSSLRSSQEGTGT